MKTTININVKKSWEASKGHPTHRGGAGAHADRRTKRNRTRSTQVQSAMKD